MDFRKVVRDFYHHFEKMDPNALLPMFAPGATIHSPTLGKQSPQTFYKDLFSKTKRMKANIKDLFVNPDNPHRLAANLNFTWETKNNETMTFEGIVIFEVNGDGKIKMIEIIYDAQRARDALAKLP